MNQKSPTKIDIDNQKNDVSLHSEANTSTANQVKKGQFIYSFKSISKCDGCCNNSSFSFLFAHMQCRARFVQNNSAKAVI